LIGGVALPDGLIDRNGKPRGIDFASFYAVDRLAGLELLALRGAGQTIAV
jgi:hypothetical protein